jgi:Family of unknown function (DUF5670)
MRPSPAADISRVWGFVQDAAARTTYPEAIVMLWTIAVVLLVLWGLGLVTSYTLNGFIHILLVLAVIAVVVNLIGRRRVL